MRHVLMPRGRRSRDLYVLIGMVLVSIPITIFANLNFVFSTLLFFGVPSFYLIWRNPKSLLKATIAGVVLGLILGFSFDFVAEFNNAWGWSADFALPFQFFGTVSLDILIWYFFWVFLVVAFYEYFLDHDCPKKISPHALTVALIGGILAVLVVTASKIAPGMLRMNYAYAQLGSLTFIVTALILFKHPGLLHKVIKTMPFFAFMYLAYEITALYLGLWNFPGAYLGSMAIGAIRFPVEELIVWIIASSTIVATYYEFCVDDDE